LLLDDAAVTVVVVAAAAAWLPARVAPIEALRPD
jgi:hypothetical protein